MLKEIIIRVVSGLIVLVIFLIAIFLLFKFVLIPMVNIKVPSLVRELIKF